VRNHVDCGRDAAIRLYPGNNTGQASTGTAPKSNVIAVRAAHLAEASPEQNREARATRS
jgi:hypothetical protein